MGTWTRVLTLGVVFAGGWGGALLQSKPPARAAEPPVESVAAACTDPSAMEANANLVAQVHDYRTRLSLAEGRRDEAESKVVQLSAAAQTKHLASSDEWARMSREQTLRLKLPCANWDGYGGFSVRRPRRGAASGGGRDRRFERNQRAEMAELSSEERDTLTDVYRRAHARTWAAMRTACEADSDYRDSMKDLEEPNDGTRIEMCRSYLLNVHDVAHRTAIARVTELRAARGGMERATGEIERVTFVLTDAAQTLDEEMVKAFGREKATRIADNGVTCFDETIYSLREADG